MSARPESRTLFAALPLAALLVFGPPSIRITQVTDRASAPVPGAVLAVTAQHHVETEPLNVTGTIEGMASGKRVTRPLALVATTTRGQYGVVPQWEVGKPWVLVFTTAMGEHGTAVGLVRIGADGKVLGIDSPNTLRTIGKPLPPNAVEDAVREALRSVGAR